MKTRKLNDVFTPDNGIFTYLNNYEVPWNAEDIAGLLDIEYHFNIAGTRNISPLVKNLLGDDETLTSEARTRLSQLIFSMYNLRWTKLWNTLQFEYNPIENYDMEEKLTNDRKQAIYGKTDTLTHGLTETITHATTDTITHNTTDTRMPALTTETENTLQGFNSATYQPDTKSETSETGTDTNTKTGTETDAKTGTETNARTGSDTNTAGGTDTYTHEYTLTRHGNIGVTTSQQMIESERTLWSWEFFYDVVFPDINRVLTLSIY